MHRIRPSTKPRPGPRAAPRAGAALAVGVLMLAGCGEGAGPFAALDLPETPPPADAGWPRLVQVPDYTPQGAPGALDPAEGRRVAEGLSAQAAASAAEARRLGAAPVLGEGGADGLRAAARASRR